MAHLPEQETGPCGSWRVLHWTGALASEMVWCVRTGGPCPWPETDLRPNAERNCATEPGTTLRVSYSDEWIDDSLKAMESLREVGITPNQRDVSVAIDALRACGAGEVDGA